MWLFAGSAGSSVLRGVIVMYAARKLGVEGYGIFSYALGLAGFFLFFKNIGVDGILTREIAKYPERQHHYFSTALGIEIVLLAITAFLLIFVAPLFSGVEEAVVLLPLVALIFILDDLKDLFIAFFRGKEKMELEALVVVAANLALVIIGFITLSYWPTPQSFVASNALASFVGVVVAAWLLKPFIRGMVRNFERNLIAPILKSAWPLAVSSITGAFLFNVDIVMLGWWRGVEEVGLYAAAQKMVGILAIFSGFVATATLPSLSRLAHSDREKMGRLLESAMKIIFIIAIPLVVGGGIIKNELIGFIFGQSYLPAVNAFAILLFSILAIHPLAIMSNLLFVFDKQYKMIHYSIIASVCNVTFNFLLIPRYGMEGAALATLISFSLYILLLWRLSKKIYKFSMVSGLKKAFYSAVMMGCVVYILRIGGVHVLINIVLSSMVYFLCLYLMKEKLVEEISSVFRLYSHKNKEY